jgi:hypothetical protein
MSACIQCGGGHGTPGGQLQSSGTIALPNKARLIMIHKTGGVAQKSPQVSMTVPVEANADGTLIFQYNVPRPSIPPGGSHCSDVRVIFYLDGQEIYTSEWLGYESRNPALPLITDLVAVEHVALGTHQLTVQGEGRYGGCNYGNLFAWDGTLLILED